MNKGVLIGGILVVAAVALAGGFWMVSRGQKIETGVMPVIEEESREILVEPTGETVMEETGVVKEFVVEGSPFKFSLAEMRVKKGDTVRVTFKNIKGTHDWVLDEFDARTNQIGEGEEEEIEFTADKVGTFEYYCSVGDHRARGMAGELIVE